MTTWNPEVVFDASRGAGFPGRALAFEEFFERSAPPIVFETGTPPGWPTRKERSEWFLSAARALDFELMWRRRLEMFPWAHEALTLRPAQAMLPAREQPSVIRRPSIGRHPGARPIS